MTPQANGVFWIGLILILLNFYLGGQFTSFWGDIAHPNHPGQLPPGSNPGGSGIIGGSGGNLPGTNPGPMILPIP